MVGYQPVSESTENVVIQDGGGEGEGRGRGRRKEPSLAFTLAKTFGSTYVLGALFKLAQDLLGFVGPQLLK